jgi:hypothetical protein
MDAAYDLMTKAELARYVGFPNPRSLARTVRERRLPPALFYIGQADPRWSRRELDRFIQLCAGGMSNKEAVVVAERRERAPKAA